MKRTLPALLAAALATAALAQDAYVVRCGRIHLGDGRSLASGYLLVRNGRLEHVGEAAPTGADALPVVDLRDKVVVPGLIAADTDLAGNADSDYQVTPDVVAVDAFDFSREQQRALAGGVTTVYLSPGRNRLVPGQGSVVKTFGEDDARVLRSTCCLRVTLGEPSTKAPPLFEPGAAPTADDPLRPARRQLPTARISQLAELRRVFREAQVAAQQGLDDVGPGADENQYDPAALLRVLRGELPVRAAAGRGDDIRRALQLAGALGARLVLEDPAEVDKVAALVARAGAMVSLRLPVRPGRTNPGGENRLDETPRVTLDAAVAAARLELPLALSPSHDDDLQDLLLLAALTVRAGVPAPLALRAITGDAAKVLGVADRVGVLAPGRDADFVVLSGDPLATGTVVEKTYVQGELAFARAGRADLLAIRAARVLTADGPPLHDAVVLVEHGKIKAVGQNLSIPFGARVLETRGVVVPGFVDAYCHAGLSAVGGDGQIPRGAADQMVANVVARDDPTLRAALAAGVTTVVVSGKDGTAVSGRAAALKTGARDAGGLVVKPVAAQRFVVEGVDPDALDALDSLVERTQRYIESWQKYEKALAEGKEVEIPLEKPSEEDPITGVWEGDLQNPQLPFTIGFNLNLKLSGEAVAGQVAIVMRGQERPPTDIERGTFKDGKLSLSFALGMGGSVTLEGSVADDTLDATLRGGFLNGPVKAKRVSKDVPADLGGGGLRKPRIDESLEPMRALLEGKAVAVVRAGKAPAIARVLEWAKTNKVRTVLHDAVDAARTPAILGEEKAGVLLDPDFVKNEDGVEVNVAKQLDDAGVQVAIVSAATAGARFLPVHAAYAVHHGLDADAALRAVTLHPATLLGIADRVGSLTPGKDADLVLFSGDPFELQSRVEAVVCNGEIVVDNRSRGPR
ncbi:MAG: amidohydrolase family protein [Planctomycetota bacterium]